MILAQVTPSFAAPAPTAYIDFPPSLIATVGTFVFTITFHILCVQISKLFYYN